MTSGPSGITRRQFVRATAGAGTALLAAPHVARGASRTGPLARRTLGRTHCEVATLGLGGQASLQWTPQDVDPVRIIVEAYELGVNYFDTSNVYGDSQLNYGKAFRQLGLVPGLPNYEEQKRRRVVVASKTMLRAAKGRISGSTQGPAGSTVVDDLRRSLSQMFGDGRGGYPSGAQVDLFQIHNLNTQAEVDAIYQGLENTARSLEQIGALAALRDFRDGTNLTGLNPREERLLRHIGITGHRSSPVLMDCIQRDGSGVLDTLLVAINANDRRHFSHQHNVIPVAAAKRMGVIAMKVFADGVMYGRKPGWNSRRGIVVRSVGSARLPSAPLVQYSLSVPGVSTAIIGIGHVDADPSQCQLQQNLAAAQLEGPVAEQTRRETEAMAAAVREGQTNYFQLRAEPLSPPQRPDAEQQVRQRQRTVRLSWHTAFAADEPIAHYVVSRDGQTVGQVDHRPQTSKRPFEMTDSPADHRPHVYRITTVDAAGGAAASEDLVVEATG